MFTISRMEPLPSLPAAPLHLLSLWRAPEYATQHFRVVEEVEGRESTFLVERISTGKTYELLEREVTMEILEFQELAATVANGIVAEVRDLAAKQGDETVAMLSDSDIDVPEQLVRGRIAAGLLDAAVPHHSVATLLERYFKRRHDEQVAQHQSAQLSKQRTNANTAAASAGGFSDSKGQRSLRPTPPSGPLSMEALLSEGGSTSRATSPPSYTADPNPEEVIGQMSSPRGAPAGSPSPALAGRFYCPVQRVIDAWVSEVEGPSSRPSSPSSAPKTVTLTITVVLEHVPYSLNSLQAIRRELAPPGSSSSSPWSAAEVKTIAQSLLFTTAALEDLYSDGALSEVAGAGCLPVPTLDYNSVGCSASGDLEVGLCKVRLDALGPVPKGQLPGCVVDWQSRYPRPLWDTNHRETVAVLYGLGHAPRPGTNGSARSWSPTSLSSLASRSPKGSSAGPIRRLHIGAQHASRLNRFMVGILLLDLLRVAPESSFDIHVDPQGAPTKSLTALPPMGTSTSTGRYHLPTEMPDSSILASNFQQSQHSHATEADSGALLLLCRCVLVTCLGHQGDAQTGKAVRQLFDALPLDSLGRLFSLYQPSSLAKPPKGSLPRAIEEQYSIYAWSLWRRFTDGGTISAAAFQSDPLTAPRGSRPNSNQSGHRPSTTPSKFRRQETPSGNPTALPSGGLQPPTNRGGSASRASFATSTTTVRSIATIGAAVGIEETRHVFYCSSFDYSEAYGGDSGRRRRQFYAGYHEQRYPRGVVAPAPPAMRATEAHPTHPIPSCPSWSHEEAVANVTRRRTVPATLSIQPLSVTARSPVRPQTSSSMLTVSSRPGTTAGSRPVWANMSFDEEYASAKKEKKESTIDYSKRLRNGTREQHRTRVVGSLLGVAHPPTTSPKQSPHNESPRGVTAFELPAVPPLKGTHNHYYPRNVAARLPSPRGI